MISFDLTKEQELVLKSAKEFAAGELRDISRECDETGSIPEKVLNKAWEIGLANAAVPEAYGGSEWIALPLPMCWYARNWPMDVPPWLRRYWVPPRLFIP